MKCQNLFPEKKKRKEIYFNMSSAENFTQSAKRSKVNLSQSGKKSALD